MDEQRTSLTDEEIKDATTKEYGAEVAEPDSDTDDMDSTDSSGDDSDDSDADADDA